MAEKRFEQYEIWVDNRGKWERIAFFRHLDVASAIFATRTYRQKLVHATYDADGKKTAEDTLAELGRTREEEHHPRQPTVEAASPATSGRSRLFPKRKAS